MTFLARSENWPQKFTGHLIAKSKQTNRKCSTDHENNYEITILMSRDNTATTQAAAESFIRNLTKIRGVRQVSSDEKSIDRGEVL